MKTKHEIVATEMECRECGQSTYDGRDITAISCSKDIYDVYRYKFNCAQQEVFSVLCMNSRNEIMAKHDVAKGSGNIVIVKPADVFREAVKSGAVSVAVVHNHPSNNTTPSPEDRQITDKLIHAGELLGIRLLDHVIICASGYYSFCDSGDI